MKKLFYLLTLGMLFLSACSSDEEEKYKPTKPTNDGSVAVFQCPDENHPHAIDLGLPSGTKWSCCNLDAQTPEAFGNYYAWGETEPRTEFTWGTYSHYSYDKRGNVTFNNLGDEISGTQYDAAHTNWGGKWVMPSRQQVEELMANCKRIFISRDLADGTKVKGTEVTGPNGAKIFLPAAGYYSDKGLNPAGGQASMWTGTLVPADDAQPTTDRAVRFNATSLKFEIGAYYRFYGLSIRPVAKP